MIAALDTGLQKLSSASSRSSSSSKLGEGELRRRRDLLSSARREKDGLENLLNAMAAKSAVDKTIASASATTALMGAPKPVAASGRVLGRETDRTRALDNGDVLQLQKQLILEQDEDVKVLAQAVARQKELGEQIQEELAVQNGMLDLLDEDVDRVQGKLHVARERVAKIS